MINQRFSSAYIMKNFCSTCFFISLKDVEMLDALHEIHSMKFFPTLDQFSPHKKITYRNIVIENM